MTRDESLDDWPLGLVVDAQHPKRTQLTLVVNANGRHGPAPHRIARDQRLFRTIKLAAGEFVYDREDALAELRSGRGVALGEIADDRGEVCLRLGREVDRHRRMIESMVFRTWSTERPSPA